MTELLTVAAVTLLAVISPGPDFAVVTRNSLACSRRAGVWSASGVALGILVHVAYCLAGIGLLVAGSPLLFVALRYLGAGYLVWVGIQSLRARLKPAAEAASVRGADLGRLTALRQGFLTNVLNPKATLFFLSLFTQVIRPTTPPAVQALYGVMMAGLTFAWFAIVALTFSHAGVKRRIARAQHVVVKAMGVLLVALGAWIALSG